MLFKIGVLSIANDPIGFWCNVNLVLEGVVIGAFYKSFPNTVEMGTEGRYKFPGYKCDLFHFEMFVFGSF